MEELEGLHGLYVYFGVNGFMFTETFHLVHRGVQKIDGFVISFG